jgi:hypothetical protein
VTGRPGGGAIRLPIRTTRQEAIMDTQLDRRERKAMLRAKLIELIELSIEHGIDIESLMK